MTRAVGTAVPNSAEEARPLGMAKHDATTGSDLALAGCVEQDGVKPGEEVISLPTHTASNPCIGKVFAVEVQHQRLDQACTGDGAGLNIKGLDKNNMHRSGDVMVHTTSFDENGPSRPRAYGTTSAAASTTTKSGTLFEKHDLKLGCCVASSSMQRVLPPSKWPLLPPTRRPSAPQWQERRGRTLPGRAVGFVGSQPPHDIVTMYATHNHRHTHTLTHTHTHTLTDTDTDTDTDTHRHTQTHTDTHRHTQTHTDTHRHTQTHTDTHRHTQTHTDTHRHTQTHTDTRRHTQTHADTRRHTQTHADTRRHTQTHAELEFRMNGVTSQVKYPDFFGCARTRLAIQ